MKFDKIHQDASEGCDCVENGVEDLENNFVRLAYIPSKESDLQKPKYLEKSFRSKWERNTDNQLVECSKYCGKNGISIHLWNASTKKEVIKKLEKDFGLTRDSPNCILIVKFYKDAGVVKQSGFKTHYNFFKSDTFDVAKIQIVESLDVENIL
jgi:hypothetical protein